MLVTAPEDQRAESLEEDARAWDDGLHWQGEPGSPKQVSFELRPLLAALHLADICSLPHPSCALSNVTEMQSVSLVIRGERCRTAEITWESETKILFNF